MAVLPAAGDRTPAGTPRRLSQRFAEMACGCDGSGFGLWDPTDPALLAEMKAAEEDEEEEQQEEESEEEGGSCGYEAWLLPLRAGQNAFNLTLPEDDQVRLLGAGGCICPAPGRGKPLGMVWGPAQRLASSRLPPPRLPPAPVPPQAGSPEQLFTLTVVHLADPEHAELQSLTGAPAP